MRCTIPVYEYVCDECGLKFEVLKGLSAIDKAEVCPECKQGCRRIMSPANHSFAHTPTGPTPQNTGVSQIDHNYDRVIGRDAERRWGIIEERNKYKRSKIREAAQNEHVAAGMEHLVRTREGAGDYRLITEPERQEVNARRALADAVIKATHTPSPTEGERK